jgi:hypothetical protein
LHVAVVGQQVQGPGELHGGGLVAGDEEGDELIAELLVGEGRAIVVAGGEQAPEQVAPTLPRRPAPADQVEEDRVQGGALAGQGAAARQGHPQRQESGEAVGLLPGGLDHPIDVGAEVAHRAVQGGVEQRAHDDVEGEAHQAGPQVDDALGQRLGEGAGAVGHHAGEGRHLAGAEDRRDQAAVALPGLPLRGEQPLAEDLAEAPGDAILAQVVFAAHHRLFDQRRLAHEGELEGAEADGHDGAKVAELVDEAEGIAGEGEGVPHQRQDGQRGQAGECGGHGEDLGGGGGLGRT